MTVRTFDAFYADEQPAIRRSLAVALGDVALADQCTQEAFVKAWLRWNRVSAMERPAAWVYVVAVRQGLRLLRGDRRSDSRDDAELVEGDTADATLDRLTTRELIERLPTRQRLAITLRYHADLALTDIAESMDCSIGTVKSTLHAALRRLRVEVTDAEEVLS
jgi:RNA polymerase sigma factor (sigma-70 family)